MDIIITFVFYFFIFAGIHSLLATDHIKNKTEKWLGSKFRFYGLAHTILSFITFFPAFLTWMIYSNSTPLVYTIPQWLNPFIILMRLTGIGIFVYAAFQTDFLDLIGIRKMQGKTSEILITRGAYGIVRHPLYTGGIILLLTKMEMRRLDLTAIILISIYLIIGAFIEERRLLGIFGEEYRKYQGRVSMFIPVKWIKKVTSRI